MVMRRFNLPEFQSQQNHSMRIVFLNCGEQNSPQPNANGDIVGSENCLWLNIFTPQMPDETTGLPVIVFIHGGGYRIGSANQYTVEWMWLFIFT